MAERELKYFVTACRCKSIAEAADKLYISRQALSMTLKHFEADVGVQLFDRTSHGITLTQAGQIFYERCDDILSQYEDALTLARTWGKEQKNTLRAAFSLIALKLLKANAIMAFETKYPNVSLQFSSMMSQDAWTQLAQDKLDLVCSIRPPDEYGFQYKAIKDGAPQLLVSEHSPLAKKKKIKPEDLENQTLLNASEIKQFYNKCITSGLTLHYRAFTNDPSLISEAVAQGLGAYVVPLNTLQVFNMDGLKAVPFEKGWLDLNLYITCKSFSALPPYGLEFCRFLSELCQNC